MSGGTNTSAEPRPGPARRRDTEHRLSHDVDLWMASASADGAPYLVPLSFDWDGEALVVATPGDSPTGRNLGATRTARMALGHTRDVVMIDGEIEVLEIDALPREPAERSSHAAVSTRVRRAASTAGFASPRAAFKPGARYELPAAS